MSWLTKNLLGLPAYLWLAALAAVVVTIISVAGHWQDRTIQIAQESGAIVAVNQGHETTLDQLGAANEAGNHIRNNTGHARYCECLLSATDATTSHCERYRPDELVPRGPDHPGEYCPGQ